MIFCGLRLEGLERQGKSTFFFFFLLFFFFFLSFFFFASFLLLFLRSWLESDELTDVAEEETEDASDPSESLSDSDEDEGEGDRFLLRGWQCLTTLCEQTLAGERECTPPGSNAICTPSVHLH